MAAKKKKSAELNYIDDSSDETLLRDLSKKVDSWYAYFNEHIQRARNFLSFLYTDQWDQQVRQNREGLSKPTLQFNKLVPIVRGIIGDQRDDSPQIAVIGVGEDIDQQAVDLRSDALRHIAYESDSDVIYQNCFKGMLEVGYHAAGVSTDYENEDTFKQKMFLEVSPDYQSFFFYTAAQEADKSDGDFCGYYVTISKDHYNRLYPEKPNPVSATNTYYFKWVTRDTVTICYIYYKEYFQKKLVLLSDGQEIEKSEATKLIKMQEALYEADPDQFDLLGMEPIEIVNERSVNDWKIKRCQFVQNAILEKTDWPGKLLPWVYFDGDSTVIDGERLPIPFIQDAIDTQKMINYTGSEIAYHILTSRSEKFMGTPSNFKGYEEQWRNPQQVQGALLANPDDLSGKMPEVINPPVFNAALLQSYQNSTQDLQQITGRYEEVRGAKSNAISQIAIAERKESSNAPVNVYSDNLSRGIKQLGKIQLELLPFVYDTKRTIMTRNIEGKGKSVEVNKPVGMEYNDKGELQDVLENDMKKGSYDIEIRVDGSFTSQLAKQFDTFARFIAINPQNAALVGDLMAAVSGLPNAPKLEKRLETLVPPQILAQEKGEPPPPPPPPPPPDPMVMLAQQDLQLKDKKITLDAMNDEKKLQIEAQSKGINAAATFAKARAEIKKSENDLKGKLIGHAVNAGIAKSQQASDEKIAEAETRRATLDEQAGTLKEMGI
jgi:hypothetical protein